ncbi:TPA: asparaginase [Acinetobacter baumannii]|uniref:asparaginase n=1 Tax=Acinetobacter pittii TaxID=48296 RepID=UPI003AA9DADA|nr:asparaginase [Acinetobacter baumannii]HCJ1341082.1 asparaginase [Acinetobacter baumannii]
MTQNAIALTTYRGNVVENTHNAHIAVVDAENGRLLYSFGNPYRQTLARSAAKPIQALSIIETGAFEKFNFNSADLALMCASHSSEDIHIDQTLSMLSKVDCLESDMQCGGHIPLSEKVYKKWIRNDILPTAICNNCSGKHVGMMGGALALGLPVENYHLPTHPMQIHVKHVIKELVDLPDDNLEWAIDGCNLPTPAFPLDRLAYIYAQLAESADLSKAYGIKLDARKKALAQIYFAMVNYPELVAGEGRYCTVLMKTFEHKIIGKLGADACYGIGIRASEQTRKLGAKGAIGISLKIEDGNLDALYMIVSEVLERLELGSIDQTNKLKSFHYPDMLNTKEVKIGRNEFSLNLNKHQ